MNKVSISSHIDIIKGRHDGESYDKIGRSFGITRERVRQILLLYGISGRVVKPIKTRKHIRLRLSDIQIRHIQALHKGGYGTGEIAKKYGIGDYTVRRYLKNFLDIG